METKSGLPSPAKPVPVNGALRGEIRFEQVSFAYPDAKENALTELSFTVSPGETIAIVGRNGAGKTTLFKLICRLYDPAAGRILMLDEPTSALDAQAEYDLFERLRSLTRGRTAVYISHRFSTVRRADRILFLEHGRLVEQGTHEQLMRLGGRYARLFRLQAAAYTGEDVVPEEVDLDIAPSA